MSIKKKLLTYIGLAAIPVALLIWLFDFNLPLPEPASLTNINTPNIQQQESIDITPAVVSSHTLATEAGVQMLEMGGTAADAAVAVASMLSVVEPWFSSVLGGGTWALYYDSLTDTVTSLDGVGPTGSKATPQNYAQRGGTPGMHQANTPGAWDGWMLWLRDYGLLELEDVLAPAIQVARNGYEVNPNMTRWLNNRADRIPGRPDTAAIYMRDGRFLQQGETVYQHNMANTFESLLSAYSDARDEGRPVAIQAARDHFYRGPIAEAIVAFSDEHDGYLTIEDFNGFEADIVEPISIDYKGTTVYQNPPNSQGITMLMALNILKDHSFVLIDPNHPDNIHLQAEAIKLAFADRYHHVGDPARVNVPTEEFLTDAYANIQRQRIDMDSALEWPIESHLYESLPFDDDFAHTTTFHIVDEYGNAAAVTTSLGAEFLVIGDTGIHINNRMRMIAVDDGNPNQLTPGFKVRHTSNPYMAFKDGRPYILGGNTGADTQSQGQVQQFLNIVEFGMSAQEAIARPRFVSTAFPATTFPYAVNNTLQMELDFPQSLVNELRRRGHTVEVGSGIFGDANAIVINEDGSVEFGADPRNPTSRGSILNSGN